MSKQRGSKFSDINYWKARAKEYNQLLWTKQPACLANILSVANLTKKDTVIDVGCGTGVLLPYLKDTGAKVYGLDISEAMVDKITVTGVPVIIQDIRKPLQLTIKPTVVIARMMLHHVTKGLDAAMENLYNMLDKRGRLIIVEGVPPNDSPRLLTWYTRMFALKERRLCFNRERLSCLLTKFGFKHIQTESVIDSHFDITNWAEHSCTSQEASQRIIEEHVYAPEFVKSAYDMKFDGERIFAKTRTLIISGTKTKHG